jgi:hypothetical protein
MDFINSIARARGTEQVLIDLITDDKNCGDVLDVYKYPGPKSPRPEDKRAAALRKFGGFSLLLEGHTWTKRTWGYREMKNTENLTAGYEKLIAKAWELN